MSNIHSILPLLDKDSWQWNKDQFIDETVPAGRSKDLFRVANVPGFLYKGLVVIQGEGGELSEIEIRIDNFDYTTTVKQAYAAGSTEMSAASPGVIRYDTSENLFAVSYEPTIPLAYSGSGRITITAPPNRDIVINSDALRLDILDRSSFSQSYQEATMSQLLDNIGLLEDEIRRTNENLERLIDRLDDRVGNRI